MAEFRHCKICGQALYFSLVPWDTVCSSCQDKLAEEKEREAADERRKAEIERLEELQATIPAPTSVQKENGIPEDLYQRAFVVVAKTGLASYKALEDELGLDYRAADQVFDRMTKSGFLDPRNGDERRYFQIPSGEEPSMAPTEAPNDGGPDSTPLVQVASKRQRSFRIRRSAKKGDSRAHRILIWRAKFFFQHLVGWLLVMYFILYRWLGINPTEERGIYIVVSGVMWFAFYVVATFEADNGVQKEMLQEEQRSAKGFGKRQKELLKKWGGSFFVAMLVGSGIGCGLALWSGWPNIAVFVIILTIVYKIPGLLRALKGDSL